jgi:hypothetical protein
VTAAHAPTDPGTLQASQVPHADVVQHTPSTQSPLAHPAPASHACPGQEAPLQQTPSMHDPLAHSLHPGVLQSAVRLHEEPSVLKAWQKLSAPQ